MKRIPLTIGVSGRYKLTVRNSRGEITRETPWFDNLITDAGLEQLGTGDAPANDVMRYCHVGSGNTAPEVGDTALVSFIASALYATNATTAQATAPYYGSKTRTYRFNAGVATGNISEVGICGKSDNTLALFSRALVLDGSGNPTTITVLADESLDVTYELRDYPPLADVTGSVVINGTSYNYTMRAAIVTNAAAWATYIDQTCGASPAAGNLFAYTGAIGSITQTPSGTQITGATTTFANLAYSANSLVRQMLGTFGLNDAVGNILSVLFYTTYGAYQLGFDAAVPKNNTQTFQLTFQIAWARKTL